MRRLRLRQVMQLTHTGSNSARTGPKPQGSDSYPRPQQGFPSDEQARLLARANCMQLLAGPAAPSLLTDMRVCLFSLSSLPLHTHPLMSKPPACSQPWEYVFLVCLHSLLTLILSWRQLMCWAKIMFDGLRCSVKVQMLFSSVTENLFSGRSLQAIDILLESWNLNSYFKYLPWYFSLIAYQRMVVPTMWVKSFCKEQKSQALELRNLNLGAPSTNSKVWH